MPTGLDVAEEACWEFSRRLAGTPGPLDTTIWNTARDCLGNEGVANLAHIDGAYAYMCLYQNAADIASSGAQKL